MIYSLNLDLHLHLDLIFNTQFRQFLQDLIAILQYIISTIILYYIQQMSKNKLRVSSNTFKLSLFLLMLILFQVKAINQQCTTSDNNLQIKSYYQDLEQQKCPQHSYCASNRYCVCQQNYMGDCSTYAFIPTENFATYTINQDYVFFILRPSQVNVRVNFKLTICDHQTTKVTQYIQSYWIDDGSIVKPDDTNSQSSGGFLLMDTCIQIFFNTKLQSQPNGQHSYIIFGLRINQIANVKPTINLVQTIQDQTAGIIKIIIIVASVLAAMGISLGIYCLYKKRKRNLKQLLQIDQKKDFLIYFKDLMPQRKLNEGDFKGIHCVVCLGDFLKGQIVRKIICNHVFHVKCLNEYCQQQLNCPICKFPLDKDSIKEKISQSQKSMLSMDDNTMTQQLIKKYQESSQRIN